VKRFRGGLLFKAHRHFYQSTLGLRVIEKKKKFIVEHWRPPTLAHSPNDHFSFQIYGRKKWKPYVFSLDSRSKFRRFEPVVRLFDSPQGGGVAHIRVIPSCVRHPVPVCVYVYIYILKCTHGTDHGTCMACVQHTVRAPPPRYKCSDHRDAKVVPTIEEAAKRAPVIYVCLYIYIYR